MALDEAACRPQLCRAGRCSVFAGALSAWKGRHITRLADPGHRSARVPGSTGLSVLMMCRCGKPCRLGMRAPRLTERRTAWPTPHIRVVREPSQAACRRPPESCREWALKGLDLATVAAGSDRLPILEARSASGALPLRLAAPAKT